MYHRFRSEIIINNARKNAASHSLMPFRPATATAFRRESKKTAHRSILRKLVES